MSALSVAIFGVAGVLARYGLGLAVSRWYAGAFPAATFAVNVSGSFAIGVVYALGVERAALSPELRVGLLAGFLGGFTTFSSYSLELVRLLEAARYGTAALYFASSSLVGFGATALGLFAARRLA